MSVCIVIDKPYSIKAYFSIQCILLIHKCSISFKDYTRQQNQNYDIVGVGEIVGGGVL